MRFDYLFALMVFLGSPELTVGTEKQLFVDDLFFAERQGVSLRLHPATKSGEKTLLPDKPWEDATLGWFSVLDDDGIYRMWYECYDVEGWPGSDDTSFCYAESRDGVHWDKPSLNLFPYHGANDTNILFRLIGPEAARSRVHGSNVFKDPSAPPDARYKAVSQGNFRNSTAAPNDPPAPVPPQGYYRVAGMYSADGLHWTRYPDPICTVMADSQYSCFWDDAIRQYVLYGRASGHGRALGRSSSGDFTHFEPLTLVLETDAQTEPDRDLYNPAALKYPYAQSVYLMFPSYYRHDTQTLEIRLAVSRDGIHWTWPERDVPFVSLGAKGRFDSGSLYMGQGLIRKGDELWQYYSGSPLGHDEAELPNLTKPGNERVYSRVVSRLDGYVSVDAEAEGGYFVTPPLVFAGSILHLNAVTGNRGSVRIGLLEQDGSPVEGRSIEDCTPITGNHIDARVTWKNGADVSSRVGKPTQLRVELHGASLYAFQFTEDTPPQAP